MPTPASQRRDDAIGRVLNETCPEWYGHLPVVDHVKAAELIRPLAELGRTGRWQNAIKAWAAMVEECAGIDDSDARYRHLTWAIKQGSVYACHARD